MFKHFQTIEAAERYGAAEPLFEDSQNKVKEKPKEGALRLCPGMYRWSEGGLLLDMNILPKWVQTDFERNMEAALLLIMGYVPPPLQAKVITALAEQLKDVKIDNRLH